MCGINGIAFSPGSGRQIDENVLCRMRDVFAYRGPDDAGAFIDGNVGLGHRRLSIVDVSNGHQPMKNSQGSLVITYNGEIYNHADHREDLIARGHTYQTHCDTETILHLYAEYGAGCVEYLRGMFAFAIWDARKKELFIARDRFGVKPLYYVHDEQGNLFFASEIKALLEAGAVKAEVNFNVLPDQLANHGTSGDETLFAGVKRLAPGHTLLWKDGCIEIRKFWDLSFEPKHEAKSDAEFVEEWRDLFRESVKLRLMADVPLGMFLSGGIDSSAIAAMMSTMVDDPIKTFSVAFNERDANELEYARLVAEKYKTDHHEITISPAQFFEALPQLIWHEDEPLGFSASVPLYFVSKLAQQHVKVVLTGEGSDEILGGYGRYQKALALLNYGEKYESFTPGFLREAVKAGVATLPASLNRKLKRTFLALDADIENLYFDNFAIFTKLMQGGLLSAGARARIADTNPYTGLHRWMENTDAEELLDKLLYADTKTYLHELLMKQDQMSMAASIESRVPFLDHKLVEFTARMPVEMKLRGKTTKWLLREAMKGILPETILTRKKMGFPVPLGNWFRNEFKNVIDEYVLSERALSRGIFNAEFVRGLVAQHNGGENHDQRLWFLVNFEMWQRRFIDGETK
ncbi:MAG TPA: asparagine synthase (glutamine-hydrolyzing) [Pyrinomonadaceae bacterium]|jgi:asparagine synthase (glutamine-hydrolysing)|nr:asparagine synthase (glutamine-hydrolyzing) [Pyrinomonadaceae bacterium]